MGQRNIEKLRGWTNRNLIKFKRSAESCISDRIAKCISTTWELIDLAAALLKGEVVVDCKLSINRRLLLQIRQSGLHWKECGEYIKVIIALYFTLRRLQWEYFVYISPTVQEGCWKTEKGPKEG